jgi:hypothetical protein
MPADPVDVRGARGKDVVYVVVVRFRLKRAEEEEGQGRGRREWCVFGGKSSSPPLLLQWQVYGRKVRLQAWKRADQMEKKELPVPHRAGTTYHPASTCGGAVVSACMCMMIDE